MMMTMMTTTMMMMMMMMMMIRKRIPKENFKRNPSQTLSGTWNLHYAARPSLSFLHEFTAGWPSLLHLHELAATLHTCCYARQIYAFRSSRSWLKPPFQPRLQKKSVQPVWSIGFTFFPRYRCSVHWLLTPSSSSLQPKCFGLDSEVVPRSALDTEEVLSRTFFGEHSSFAIELTFFFFRCSTWNIWRNIMKLSKSRVLQLLFTLHFQPIIQTWKNGTAEKFQSFSVSPCLATAAGAAALPRCYWASACWFRRECPGLRWVPRSISNDGSANLRLDDNIPMIVA